MEHYISIPELCTELELTGISHFKQRFGDIGTLRLVHSWKGAHYVRVLTPAEADIIRAAYQRRRKVTKDNPYGRKKPEQVVIGGVACTPEQHILNTVALHFGVSPERLLAKDRSLEACNARKVAYKLLTLEGYSVAEAGRILHRDHSTVVHGLLRADMEQVAHLREVLRPSLDRLLADETRGHPAARAICAYVHAVVQPPQRPHPASLLYSGLHALARDGALRQRIQGALERLEQGSVMPIMAHHAAKLGFGWEESA